MLERLIKKTTLTDVFIVLVSAFAIIAFWRGMWNLMDMYLTPDNFLLSQIISIVIGIIILVIISRVK